LSRCLIIIVDECGRDTIPTRKGYANTNMSATFY